MTNYQILNTIKSDLPFIYWLFDEAIAFQKRKNVPVWPTYDKPVLNQDIEQKLQYKIVKEGEIACIFTICYSDKIVWREHDKDDSIFLHRIVTNPKFKGQKLFEKVFEWSKKHAQEKGLKYVRMDTWGDNPNLIAYYQSFGFEKVEYFTTPDTEELPIQQRENYVVLLEFKL